MVRPGRSENRAQRASQGRQELQVPMGRPDQLGHQASLAAPARPVLWVQRARKVSPGQPAQWVRPGNQAAVSSARPASAAAPAWPVRRDRKDHPGRSGQLVRPENRAAVSSARLASAAHQVPRATTAKSVSKDRKVRRVRPGQLGLKVSADYLAK